MLMLQVKRVSRIAILDIAVPGCRFNGEMLDRDLAGISSEITMNAQRILCLNRVATRDTTLPRPSSNLSPVPPYSTVAGIRAIDMSGCAT